VPLLATQWGLTRGAAGGGEAGAEFRHPHCVFMNHQGGDRHPTADEVAGVLSVSFTHDPYTKGTDPRCETSADNEVGVEAGTAGTRALTGRGLPVSPFRASTIASASLRNWPPRWRWPSSPSWERASGWDTGER
jgi:hypothetical protein